MKHLKTSLKDLRQLFENTVTARHLAEPFVSFDGSGDAGQVASFMKDKGFDVVGVRKHGTVVGFVARKDLSGGTLDDHRRSFDEQDLLGESTGIMPVLRQLTGSSAVFVQILDQTAGIITKGDLQKAPVRMWLFGLLSLIEMQFLRLIRSHYPNDSWARLISEDRLKTASSLLADRRRRNEAVDLADCLQFSDKSSIILKSPELRDHLKFKSKKDGKRLLKEFEDLRNELAHAQDILGAKWKELARLAERAEGLLDACEQMR